jgi:peptidoglycan/LPS O-acetylase OafA/YrhL
MVFVCHTESARENFYLPNGLQNYFYTLIGKLGVILFFVLSGFLITFLLLEEKAATKNVDIKRFYYRRMLRIWPLYFLIVFFSFFVAPHASFFYMPNFISALNTDSVTGNFIAHLLIFPNLAISLFGVVPYAGHLWSVGVEEQFYVLWPWLIEKVKNKPLLFAGTFFFYIAAKIPLLLAARLYMPAKIVLGFWYYFNIDCMAIGAMAAYLVLYKKQKILSVLYSKWIQIITPIILIILISNGYQFKWLSYEAYGILFAIVILNLGCNKNCIFSLENKVLNFLGKISYGIYMFHFIALTIAIRMLMYFNFPSGFAIYIVAAALTLALSVLSYFFFEAYFLRKKDTYSVFKKSGNFT